MDLKNKCVITAALTGAATRKEQNPAVPFGAEEIIEDAVRCYEAGAAVVHIHMRTKDGKSSADPEEMRPMVEGIRERCPILINLSTAVGYGKTPEERISVVQNFKPELASLNSGSMNFGRADWKSGEIAFGFVFQNTFQMIKDFNEEMKKAGTKPELEVYDIGHIDTIMLMRKSGMFEEPLHFQFVFGVAGGMQLTPGSFALCVERIPDDATWSACGVGPNSFRSAFMAASNGGHVRVGLEDNLYVSGKTQAKGNWDLVEKAVQIVKHADREPATPEEAREILNLSSDKKS